MIPGPSQTSKITIYVRILNVFRLTLLTIFVKSILHHTSYVTPTIGTLGGAPVLPTTTAQKGNHHLAILKHNHKTSTKITIPIEIQILYHIHINSLFLLLTPTQVTFNATVLAPIFQYSVFSQICLRRKIKS